MSGILKMGQNRKTGLQTTTPQTDKEATSSRYVLSLIHALPNFYLDLAGSRPMKGNLNMNGNSINNVKEPTIGVQTVNTSYLEGNYFEINGLQAMLGNIDMSNKFIKRLKDPLSDYDAADKRYVDSTISKSHIKPSHQENQFAYLMSDVLE